MSSRIADHVAAKEHLLLNRYLVIYVDGVSGALVEAKHAEQR